MARTFDILEKRLISLTDGWMYINV